MSRQAAAAAFAGHAVQLWSADPLVLTIDDYFSAAELEYIRSHAEGKLKRATVSTTSGGSSVRTPHSRHRPPRGEGTGEGGSADCGPSQSRLRAAAAA
eukprot:SAG11_NODE_14555_length_608_cov_0.689587_2_plen_97_part_01